MKVLIFGSNKSEAVEILNKAGFEIVENNADFVVSFGGDGTLMKSEAQYPSIPKIVLRDSRVCKVCSPLSNDEVLTRIKAGQYKIRDLEKLETKLNGKQLVGINDIIVHNGDPRHGIRYNVWVGDKQLGNTIIGDGIVVATPLGSRGYYRSITDSFFEAGIGLAFNNSTEGSDHMVIDGSQLIRIKIERGPAVVYADNHEEYIELSEGEEVIIKKSDQIGRMVVV